MDVDPVFELPGAGLQPQPLDLPSEEEMTRVPTQQRQRFQLAISTALALALAVVALLAGMNIMVLAMIGVFIDVVEGCGVECLDLLARMYQEAREMQQTTAANPR